MSKEMQGTVFPPVQVSLRFCSVCGRTDRYTHLKAQSYHHGKDGKRCPGQVESITYEITKGPADE